MADTTLQQVFQSTANAIRGKTGETSKIYPSSFSYQISSLETRIAKAGSCRSSASGAVSYDSSSKKLTVQFDRPSVPGTLSFSIPMNILLLGSNHSGTTIFGSDNLIVLWMDNIIHGSSNDCGICLGEKGMLTNGLGPSFWKAEKVNDTKLKVLSQTPTSSDLSKYFKQWEVTCEKGSGPIVDIYFGTSFNPGTGFVSSFNSSSMHCKVLAFDYDVTPETIVSQLGQLAN